MPRKEARIQTSVWRSDITRLSLAGQGLVWMLVSQADLSMAGTLPYLPARWAALCGGSDVAAAARELQDAGWLAIDAGTSEVVITRFLAIDEVMRSIKTRRAFWTAWSAILSAHVRTAALAEVTREHQQEAVDEGWISITDLPDPTPTPPTDTPPDRATDAPSDTPSHGPPDTPSDTPPDALHDGASPRARAPAVCRLPSAVCPPPPRETGEPDPPTPTNGEEEVAAAWEAIHLAVPAKRRTEYAQDQLGHRRLTGDVRRLVATGWPPDQLAATLTSRSFDTARSITAALITRAEQLTGPPPPASPTAPRADTDCPTCAGSGWDCTGNNAVPCPCLAPASATA